MNKTISIAKAIAIILMVVGHAGCPELFHDFIYAFHMPLFFCVSGYLFKDKYLSEPLGFIKRKFKGLYIPYVQWSLIFLVFHNLFVHMGLYEADTLYSLTKILKCIPKYILMWGNSEMFLAGYWFLKELLIVSIISFFTIKLSKNKLCFLYAIMFLLIAYLYSVAGVNLPYISSRTFLACSMFLFGYYFKVGNMEPHIHKWYVPIAGYLLALILILTINDIDSMKVQGWRIFPYAVTAVAGSLAVYATSIYIDRYMKKVSDILTYIGKHTLFILTFHAISFKIVTWFLIQVVGVRGNMYDFFVIPNLGWWWILYSVVGVVVPMLLWSADDKISKMLFKNR